MEKAKQISTPKPHRPAVIATLVLGLVTIVVIESTTASKWIVTDGLIHLAAIVFVVIAALITLHLRGRAFAEFRSYLNRILIAMAILGFSHIIEYFIDVKGLVDEKYAPLVITGSYTVALATMIMAAMSLIGAEIKRIRWIWIAGAVGCLVPAVVMIAVFLTTPKFDFMLAPLSTLLSITLVAIAFIATAYFTEIGRRVPVLHSVMGHINVAVVAIMLAGLVEPAMPFLMRNLSLSEWFLENVSHYVFYAGLTFLCLAFDFPNHFGGVFLDLRKLDKELSPSKPVG